MSGVKIPYIYTPPGGLFFNHDFFRSNSATYATLLIINGLERVSGGPPRATYATKYTPRGGIYIRDFAG
jgi:hypothetical protein